MYIDVCIQTDSDNADRQRQHLLRRKQTDKDNETTYATT